ncbi:MAG TPA: transglutaminase, partial [Rhodoglobus sp.]|nr:transglutaminase [Rhodoglobus sp.]
MERTVGARIELDVSGRTNMVFAVAAALGATVVDEHLSFDSGGTIWEAEELRDLHGARLHQFIGGQGRMSVEYRATVAGRAQPASVDDLDLVTYLRPSRYCPSDSLTPTARGEFTGLHGQVLLRAVTQWVSDRLEYVSGSSSPTDGAEQ